MTQINLQILEGTQVPWHENNSQVLTRLAVARSLQGEFIFKAKNYSVSNIFFLNLLQITLKSAIVPDYMEAYTRGRKKTLRHFQASKSLLGSEAAIFNTKSIEAENNCSDFNSL